jgi:diguanylate cyclase (GGDEF)-like protein
VLRIGVVKSTLLAGAVSCLCSVAASWLLLTVARAPSETRSITLPIAFIVPWLIAPPIVWFVTNLLHEIEDARAALQAIAIRDGLTRIFNRSHFMDMARIEVAKSVRHAAPLSLLILDADDFKRVNDQYGHQTGDVVLQTLARTCADNLREHDILARYGGEEFVVLLPATEGASARRVAEKLRAAIEAAQITTESPPHVRLVVTVSIGMSSLGDSEHDLKAMFARADAALYQSKREGKNRWTEH